MFRDPARLRRENVRPPLSPIDRTKIQQRQFKPV